MENLKYFLLFTDGSELCVTSDKQVTTEHATAFYYNNNLQCLVGHSKIEHIIKEKK